MAIQPGGTAPYAPPSAIIDIVSTYRERDMRKPFDLEVLMQAGVSESLAPRTLQALKLLDIIDPTGNPTDAFETLVRAPEEEFKSGLGDLFVGAYRDIFSFADPATNDIARIRDAFRPYQPRGQQERMITLFLGLLEFAGLDISAAKVSARPKKEGGPSQPKPRPKKVKPLKTGQFYGGEGSEKLVSVPVPLVALLKTLPPEGSPWSRDQRDRFLAAFSAVLDYTYDVREQLPATTATGADGGQI